MADLRNSARRFIEKASDSRRIMPHEYVLSQQSFRQRKICLPEKFQGELDLAGGCLGGGD